MPADVRALSRDDYRERIVAAAESLLREGGPGAVTTRAVAHLAGVQAPTIYRLFGDKDGLLEAVAEHVMAQHVDSKQTEVALETSSGSDPIEDLRLAWFGQIRFGLANPMLFRLLGSPERVNASPAAALGREVLAARVRRIAAAGRLAVSEDRAIGMITAGGVGVITTLLTMAPESRDAGLPDAVWEALQANILTQPPGRKSRRKTIVTPAVSAAITLKAAAASLTQLSPGEQQLLSEWMDRTISSPPS